jgi:SdrD B-like domain
MNVFARVLLTLVILSLAAAPVCAQRIYVANSGEATVSEIDIVQEREIARFRTWTGSANTQQFNLGSNLGPAPSRIVVDAAGNIYVLNRTWPTSSDPNATLPLLFKIRPAAPLNTSTSHDANNNGVIDLLDDTEVLPLTINFLPAGATQPRQVDPAGIQEGRIEWAVEIGTRAAPDLGGLGRSLCMDLDGFLWVGLNQAQRYYKVDPANGQIVGTVVPTPGHTPYGCVVASNGTLWSASSGTTVAEIDTRQGTSGTFIGNRSHSFNWSNYAISARRDCNGGTTDIYFSNAVIGHTNIVFRPNATQQFTSPPTLKRSNNTIIPNFLSYAIAVDRDNNIISGKYDHTGGQHALVVKYDPAGNVLWDTDTPPAGPTISASDLHGLIIDEQNNVWAVHREPNASNGFVVKYRGTDGKHLKTIKLGKEPYTYGNGLPPNCPCASVSSPSATCQSMAGGIGTFNFNFTFINKNPFGLTATGVQVGAVAPVTSVTTAPISPVPPNGQATVTGTFTVSNPQAGDRVCLDIKLAGSGNGADFCCPTQQVCFDLPECRECVKAAAAFKCRPNGTHYLELNVTNNGLSATTSVQVTSTTPGVTVTPFSTPLTLQTGQSGIVNLGVTGAAPGQPIILVVSLNGPADPKTGAFTWCCSATVSISYPKEPCRVVFDGDVFFDINANGIREPGEKGFANWPVTLEAGTDVRTVKTDENGVYRFDGLPPGRYRISVKPAGEWQPTVPAGGVHDVILEESGGRRYSFGFRRRVNVNP